MVVCSTVIAKLTSELKSGKSSGPDDISLDTLKFANNRLTVVLSLCFSMCLSHSCIPPHMIKTTIVPIGENKCGKLSESNNYYSRPIALATIISKVFESVLLLKCKEYLFTSSKQFGYKKGYSTDLCINALKEFIECYRKRSKSAIVTLLDESKALDRVNFWLLFDKLNSVPFLSLESLMFGTHAKNVHPVG